MKDEVTQLYSQKRCSAHEAVTKGIRSGDRLVLGHCAATPDSIMSALYELREQYEGLKSFHMLYFGEPYHLRPEMRAHLQPYINFLDKNSRDAVAEGRAEFVPCHFHEVPELFVNGAYPVDVAILQVSPPDDEGYCSVGISTDYTLSAARAARTVIVEVNKQMPYIGGESLLHLSEIDYLVEVDRPLVSIPPAVIGETEKQIAAYCAQLIDDGATLQLGIGAIPDAVLQCLEGHKDLGIHTEMFTDGVMHFMRSGQINGRLKTHKPGKVVASLIMGSPELYRFLDHNPDVEMYPVSYTNDPYVIGLHDNLVSINSCLAVDLTGQVASESIGLRQFSGTGGQVDFLRGAKRSKGGKSILAFPSTAQGGAVSRIVPVFEAGANITTGRNEVDYMITEWGIARLRGASLPERARALCQIAHPKFRAELEEAIVKRWG